MWQESAAETKLDRIEKIRLISICVCTFKRPALLAQLLKSLAELDRPGDWSYEIIVVDNDACASARPIVKEFRLAQPDIRIEYEVEVEQSISRARNRTVALARGQAIAFIDDDESADRGWLAGLMESMAASAADAVFGPVIPLFPVGCPRWVVRGRFFERKHGAEGTRAGFGRTTNALVLADWPKREPVPFDPKLGLTGGEDSDFFIRIKQKGARLAWSEKGITYEKIEENRLNLKWLLMRAFWGGQGTADLYLKGAGPLRTAAHFPFRFSLFCLATLMAVPLLVIRFHVGVWWLRKVFSNLGQLSVLFPYRYKEYE